MTDHDPRRVRLERVLREQDEDRSGMVIVWLAVAFAILTGIIIAAVILATAPRSASHPDSRTVSVPGEGSSGAPLPDRPSPGMRELIVAAPRTGFASWYDDGAGYYGAVRSWSWGDDPYAVQVCLADRPGTCTHVVIRDYCACGDRHGEATVIDLSPSAFRELAPLSRGIVRVTVSDPIDIPLPPTDMEGAP